LIVYNPSQWDAADVDVEALYRDGEESCGSTERVPAHDEEPFAVDLRPETPGRHPYADLARVTVRYSDGQRISRYESRYTYSYDEATQFPRIEQSHDQIAEP
jgi:hypothetical protein